MVKRYDDDYTAVSMTFQRRWGWGRRRFYSEHNVTKQHSPVGLGGTISKCSFRSAGGVNLLIQKTHKKSLVLDDNELTCAHEEEKHWEPRSFLAMIDGLESIKLYKWAMTFVELGPDHVVASWFGRLPQPHSASQTMLRVRQLELYDVAHRLHSRRGPQMQSRKITVCFRMP